MSRPPASTRSSGWCCGPCWRRSHARRSWCCPPIRPRTSRPCASAWSCWTAAGSATTARSPTWSPRRPAGSGWLMSRTRPRASPGEPAPAGTATSAAASGTGPSTSNLPSKTRTCCCAAGQRRTSQPRRWRRDHGARARPARGRRRPGHVRRARRPGDAPVRPQPGFPRRCRAHRLHTLERAARHGHRYQRPKHGRGGLFRRVRHAGGVLADSVDARQRTGRRRHPGHAAGPHRRLVRGRAGAVRLRLPDPARVPALPPDRRPGVRGVQPVGADRRPGRADRRAVARRPVARGRAGPLGAVPGRRVRAVPASLRLGEPGDGPDPSASGLGARRGAAAVRTIRPLHIAPRGRRHGLARVAMVLPRLAARPVRDRGPGGAPARGRGAAALPDHSCPRHRAGGGRDHARAGRYRRVHPRRYHVMTGLVLRAGAWPAVLGVTGVAAVVGGCGAAFPAAATMLFPVCFVLLAAAAAFTLDEPASLVVDVTPTGPVRRTGIRAVALLAPLAAGALVLLAAGLRGQVLPWAAAGLALAGNVLLGFAVACVLRTRTGEPGAVAGTAVVLVLMAPSLVPPVAR